MNFINYSNDYKTKYLKYKIKYLELKKKIDKQNQNNIKIYIKDNTNDEITDKLNMSMYEDKRIPSFCDRILYKNIKNSIEILNYGTILVSNLCNSDHLLVFGEFKHGNKIGLVITFNIDKYDKDIDNVPFIQKTLEHILIKINNETNKKFNYVIFCFQESATSPNLENIIKSIVSNINNSNHFLNKYFDNPTGKFVYSHSASASWTNQNSRIIILYNNSTLETLPEELPQIYLGNFGQYVAGSKAVVGYKIDNIIFCSCHLPIDTSKKEQNSNYMGNDLRIKALKTIIEKLNNYPNVIISGDMNFRIYENNNVKKEQLDELFKSESNFLHNYKEFGKLKIKSCKINSVKSCKLVQ